MSDRSVDDLLRRLEGAIAAGIRQAVTDESTGIRFHEHRSTPDLDWVYGQSEGIARYITTATIWDELRTRLGGVA